MSEPHHISRTTSHYLQARLYHHNTKLHIANMPAPSQISIATSVVNRLVKEEKSYQREHESQKARIAKLEAGQGDDENAEYILRQEVSRSFIHSCKWYLYRVSSAFAHSFDFMIAFQFNHANVQISF